MKFSIESGKKHQIRAHASQVLHCPILFDSKYGFDLDDFKSANLRTLLKEFPDRFYEVVRAECQGDLKKAMQKNYLASLQENGTIFLHSYRMSFDYPQDQVEGEAKEQTTIRHDVKARFSLQTRTLLDMMGVIEADIYADADV